MLIYTILYIENFCFFNIFVLYLIKNDALNDDYII